MNDKILKSLTTTLIFFFWITLFTLLLIFYGLLGLVIFIMIAIYFNLEKIKLLAQKTLNPTLLQIIGGATGGVLHIIITQQPPNIIEWIFKLF